MPAAPRGANPRPKGTKTWSGVGCGRPRDRFAHIVPPWHANGRRRHRADRRRAAWRVQDDGTEPRVPVWRARAVAEGARMLRALEPCRKQLASPLGKCRRHSGTASLAGDQQHQACAATAGRMDTTRWQLVADPRRERDCAVPTLPRADARGRINAPTLDAQRSRWRRNPSARSGRTGACAASAGRARRAARPGRRWDPWVVGIRPVAGTDGLWRSGGRHGPCGTQSRGRLF